MEEEEEEEEQEEKPFFLPFSLSLSPSTSCALSYRALHQRGRYLSYTIVKTHIFMVPHPNLNHYDTMYRAPRPLYVLDNIVF